MKKSDWKRHKNYNKRAKMAELSAMGRQKVMKLILRGIKTTK